MTTQALIIKRPLFKQLLLKQKGVAIILAMSVVALATVTATAMTVSQSTWSREIELGTGRTQALLLLQAGTDWSRAILKDDRRGSIVDHSGEAWALRLPAIPVDDGNLTGHIEDQQGKFNLNNLLKNHRIDPAQLEHFRRLLSILSLPSSLADSLANTLKNTLADGIHREQFLIHPDELVRIEGFDPNVRAQLAPFVTVLPAFTAINVNTASAEVISAVVDGLSLDDARAIAAQRERRYFRNLPDFLNQIPPGLILANENISVSSRYFMVNIHSTMKDAQVQGSALLERDNTGWPRILWHKSP